MYKKVKKIHFVGVGGIGMSGLAEALLAQGYQISGSDVSENDLVKNLCQKGIKFLKGHHSRNVADAELVVFSSAISKNNPEILEAQKKKIPCIPRAEILAELMRLKYGVAVSGAHGKTTTTAMIGTTLTLGGLDPFVIVGGKLDTFGGSNVRIGKGEFMVAEADESDGSFNKLSPSIAVVTNLDREHMEYFKSMDRLKDAFLSFMNKVPFYGLCVFCGDDPLLQILSEKVTRRKRSYGFLSGNDYQILEYITEDLETKCRVKNSDDEFEMRLKIPGKHNALNALAALVVADELSIPRNLSLASLSDFAGARRRFQNRGTIQGITFVDDYAHHPTEIKATLKAAMERFPQSRIRALFQPHRYSRTEDLLEEFPPSFENCFELAVTEIYSAGEEKIPGVSSQTLVRLCEQKGQIERVSYSADPSQTIKQWIKDAQEGDVILTLGAGDLPNVYQELFPH